MTHFTNRKLQNQKDHLKQIALELMLLSGTIRRADIEIRYRPSQIVQPNGRHTPRHLTTSPLERVQI